MIVLLILLFIFCYCFILLKISFSFSVEPRGAMKTILSKDFTVVCSFKDEAGNFDKLSTLIRLCDSQKVALILIDDHSTDNLFNKLSEIIATCQNIQLIKNHGQGKKQALKTAVKLVTTPYIHIVDADCYFNEKWFFSLFSVEPSADLTIFPVNQTFGGALEKFSWFEHAALQIAGLYAGQIKQAVFCSGANLRVSKRLVESVNFDKKQGLSGDDIFLLQAAKRGDFSINTKANSNATILTDAPKTIAALVNQRIRWGSKVLKYESALEMLPAIFWLLVQIAFLSLLLIAPFSFISLLGFGVKLMAEFLFFKKCKQLIKGPSLGFNLILSSLFYPFYSVILVLLSLIYNPRWKGRKVFYQKL
jgi:biofilm PGA synthesis N-glycosyltransferase PgaC